jgi:hypothetical protein
MKPIKPTEVTEIKNHKNHKIPDVVIECVNELIIKNWDGL